MVKLRTTEQSGYVALLTVLIVGAAALAIGISTLAIGSDSQISTLVELQSKAARNLSAACAEEALQVVHDNIAYAGTGNLSMGLGSCSYTVTVNTGTTRTITTTGTVDNVVRKNQVGVTIGSSSISVTSWQEV
ncbi:MAG TPA: hypothetical protein VLF91_03330 [Candidatus Saccharimonadales bacterium]|nr:hypothetical protein [Candidatus Saccharimonadales bacterium]